MGDLVPSRQDLVKQGMRGVAGVGGGIGLLILSGIRNAGLVPGLIAGGVLAVVGLVIGRSREDRNAGLIALGAGIVTAVASIPVIGGVVGWLLPVAGIGLLLAGGYSLFKFWTNLRKRN
jgi:cell division protein FtsW (lipid II flippase)